MEPPAKATPVDFYGVLRHKLTTCPLTHVDFLPLDILQDVITVDSIRADAGWNSNPELLSNLEDTAEEVLLNAKKVYASLVFIQRQSAFEALLSEGLTDEDLPLSRQSGTSTNVLCCQKGIKTFEAFRSLRSFEVDIYLEKQWHVLAPVFDTTGSHFNLSRKCALPLTPMREEIVKTSNSQVYKCALYPAHYPQGAKVSAKSTIFDLVDGIRLIIKGTGRPSSGGN
jgi:hypothetical protein